MRIVIFGLTISSTWGNGHATLWRGLCRALHRRGHDVTFFERDVPYYAAHRDDQTPAGCRLRLYSRWETVRAEAEREVTLADVAMVTSYCPDAQEASEAVLASNAGLRVFYDLDTGVTLSRMHAGLPVEYLPDRGLGEFDLVLSYTGGRALDELRRLLGARQVEPLYGSVDPEAHRRVTTQALPRFDLSYLGTYANDRQAKLEALFVEPARRRPEQRFAIGGSQYPDGFPWTPNMYYLQHLPPSVHPDFYSASAVTLNVTRDAMATFGYCPSGRLFEAAACGAAILTDYWEGLERFFEPGEEVLVAHTTNDALAAIDLPPGQLTRIGDAALTRVLTEHTADHRAVELESMLTAVRPVRSRA